MGDKLIRARGAGPGTVIGRKLIPVKIHSGWFFASIEQSGRGYDEASLVRVFQNKRSNGKSGELKRAIAMVKYIQFRLVPPFGIISMCFLKKSYFG